MPGSEGLVENESHALTLAHQLGFPVLIKASAGGGGGMRVAMNDLSLKSALQQAQAEAEAALATAKSISKSTSSTPATSKCRSSPTITATSYTCSSATVRCSAGTKSWSRRAPPRSWTRDPHRHVRRGRAAGPGREVHERRHVEFIVDPSGNFYFIEMNARIQVEHPVTEMVTGIDLIKAQILVAAGEKLPFGQEDVAKRPRDRVPHQRRRPRQTTSGPRREPSPGCIPRRVRRAVRFPHLRRLRVSPYYDSMIGKLVVHQPTRREAIASMKRALGELRLEGVKTTIPLHQKNPRPPRL